MHLQSLELVGFKSFADKTIFNFHEGVTAVVGPNGCGKSNVLDAVRWVLGEQSAKALRGGEMADVIFSGTDSRKPVGFAEVSLTFSDCAQELGVDWHEVRVTRRVYRDGNSEYLLNKTVCRLRDIQSLFADTGVGRSAYSIMEQGKIDLILSSRPEDRRTVFEEAAGITKYKGQKKEAMRKLEATEANLLRIGDIIKEVKRQIGSLQRQAGKARRYQTLMTDLQVLDTHHSHHKLQELEAELNRCREEIARFEERERATLEKIEASENELAGRRGELDEIDTRIGDARAEVQRLHSEMSAHRSRIEFNRQRAQEISELIERYTNDIVTAETKRTEQANQISEADALIEKTNALLKAKRVELAELTEKAARLRNERSDREAELQSLQLTVSRAENRIASLGDELAGTTTRRDATAGRITELGQEIGSTTRARDEAQGAVHRAKAAADTEQQTVETMFQALRAAEEQLHAHQQSLSDAEKEAYRFERAIAEKESRLEILRQLNEEGEGLAKGSKAVLKGLADPERIRPALAGALVASLDVDREYLAALEAALGRNMHAVVLQNAELAPEILRHVASNNLGQAALALPELTPAGSDDHLLDLPEGAIGWAINKINAPRAVATLVSRLLRGVVLVQDLETAVRLKREHSVLQFVTLAGEFVSTAGVVFGGSVAAAADSLLGRKSLISATATEVSQLTTELTATHARRDEMQGLVQSTRAALEEARARHQAAHVAQSNSAAQLLLLGHELRAAEDRVRQVQTERATLEQQINVADRRVGELEQELASLTDSVDEQTTRRASAAEATEQARLQEEETSAALQDLRLAVATETQRHENLLSQRQPMAARAAELAEMIDARRSDIRNYERRLEVQTIESEQAEASLASQAGELAAAEERAAAISHERAERLAAVNSLDAELRATRNSLNELHDTRGKEQVRQTQLQLRVDNLLEHVTRRYQLDLREFSADHYAFQKTLRVQLKRRNRPTDPATGEPVAAADTVEAAPSEAPAEVDAAQLEAMIAELTRQIDNMGPVNLDAVQEYDELEERHRFLETQNNDLTASRKELLDVIAKINSTTQKLFAETFAQVRVNFREMFAELFGGGRADLSLVDENDPLNCGIDIVAKPPGKQLQTVSLLSGGERTMTAVALLFAIYMVRPSPFCILDEMDAPLDESNINRFIKMLDRFVQQSQFIIITHNKRTIAKADVLYGVTMEERGVSKLVGMRLASEKGADGELRADARKSRSEPQFPAEGAEQERQLALSR
ncbi:MAG: Chromosome partition protein smc [uncultured Chthoniobacterales bacterium]|uniref:Chromosome partition protein Smc n=1 Tax=uncultured Chthoniobacterales bacterium TaxID=1836801 RepID=A0A6J4IYT3_9BACT|nr:MAG: Chromosome partition protein smc [uncultured Chthoniobacterales bacterium]